MATRSIKVLKTLTDKAFEPETNDKTMKYKEKELVEITTPQVFDPPKKMLVWNNSIKHTKLNVQTVYAVIIKDTGATQAIGESCRWSHCAEIPTARRATNRELASWCVHGYGENTDGRWVFQVHAYPKAAENIEVDENILVRNWSDDNWHEPTVDYIGIKDVSKR